MQRRLRWYVALIVSSMLGVTAQAEEVRSIFDDAIRGNVTPEPKSTEPKTAQPQSPESSADPVPVPVSDGTIPAADAIAAEREALDKAIPMPLETDSAALRKRFEALSARIPSAAGEAATLHAILDARRVTARTMRDPAMMIAASRDLHSAFKATGAEVVASLAKDFIRQAVTDTDIVAFLVFASDVDWNDPTDAKKLDIIVSQISASIDRLADGAVRARLKIRTRLTATTAKLDRPGSEALARLQADKSPDPDSYTAAGLYLCVRRGDWEKGIPLLARGRAGSLRMAAELETQKAADRSRIADAWWNMSPTYTDRDGNEPFRLRALAFYQESLPKLTAARRKFVETRIASMTADASDASPARPDHGGPPRSIVYLLDRTGTMGGLKWSLVAKQFEQSLRLLPDETRVGVVLFHESFDAHGKQLLPLTLENRAALIAFIRGHTPKGSTNPLPGIKAAFAMKPEMILMLTDGEFDNLVSYEEVIQSIRDLNKGKRIRVSTFLFGDTDPRAEQALDKIAKSNGGKMYATSLDNLPRVN